MTLVGNRPEWVLAMLACFRLGAVVLPCTEQLRAGGPARRGSRSRGRGWSCATSATSACSARRRRTPTCSSCPGEELTAAEPVPAVELEPEDPCLVTFTSGTSGEPKAVLHGQRYLAGQHVQAEHWLGARRRTACRGARRRRAGRSRRATCSSRRGCAARRRCCTTRASTRTSGSSVLEREQVDTLCMAPTEYRVIAKRATLRPFPALRGPGRRRRGAQPRGAARLARGDRPVDPRRLRPDRDRPADRHAARRGGAARLDGPARCPGVALDVVDGELVADPATVPTFFLRYLGGDAAPAGPVAHRRPRAPRRRRLPLLRGPRSTT